MAFKKIGDAEPVLGYYDEQDAPMLCSKCGNKMIVVCIDGQNNKLLCQECDIEGAEQDD